MFYSFHRLSPVVQQVYWVLKYGTFLANCFDGAGGFTLCQYQDEGRGFFVEVGLAQGKTSAGTQLCEQ